MAGLAVLVAAVYLGSGWWRDHQADQATQDLVRLARPGDIHLLSSTTCVFCTRARQWLVARQVPFTECFIEQDAQCLAQYQATGAAGTPTLLVRGQVQLGFSAPQVRDRLAAAAPTGG